MKTLVHVLQSRLRPVIYNIRHVVTDVHQMATPSPSLCPDELRIGFLGAGRMAQALGIGFTRSGLVKPTNIMCSDVDSAMLDTMSTLVGANPGSDNHDVIRNSDVVIVAVKPHFAADLLRDISNTVTANHLIVSIAAGMTTGSIEKLLPDDTRVVRVMPNTPALVQCAASVFCAGTTAQPDDCDLVSRLFSSIGYCTQLPETQLDAVTAVSGGGPAYGFMMIEALADGGVMMGLSRDVAVRLAAQTLMGAAKMVMETDKHPGELKDMVCSAGGTTITGVHHLEVAGLRAALIGAVGAAAKQAQALATDAENSVSATD